MEAGRLPHPTLGVHAHVVPTPVKVRQHFPGRLQLLNTSGVVFRPQLCLQDMRAGVSVCWLQWGSRTSLHPSGNHSPLSLAQLPQGL